MSTREEEGSLARFRNSCDVTRLVAAAEEKDAAEDEDEIKEYSEEDIQKAAGKLLTREQVAKPTSTNLDSTADSVNRTVRGVKKIGRNDPFS